MFGFCRETEKASTKWYKISFLGEETSYFALFKASFFECTENYLRMNKKNPVQCIVQVFITGRKEIECRMKWCLLNMQSIEKHLF